MSESEIIKAVNEGFQSVSSLVRNVEEKIDTQKQVIDEQKQTIDDLNTKIQTLENRLQKLEKLEKTTSKNSNQPPSMDGFKKTKSLRTPSGKKTGGQPGHKGATLKISTTPDHLIKCHPEFCEGCGESLKQVTPTKTITRQIFDLPITNIEVTEFEVGVKICPNCGLKNEGQFPEHVKQNVQYGSKLTSFIAYLHHYQMLPFKRITELIEDTFNQKISEGTVATMIQRVSYSLEDTEEYIQQQLISSSILHLDETGCYVNDERWWLHVASNNRFTHYHVNKKRGSEAMEAAGILPYFTGTAIHDQWSPYYKFDDCTHAACNVHHLREFRAMEEIFKQEWAKEMSALLLEAKDYSETTAYPLPQFKVEEFERRYLEILESGYIQNPKQQGAKNTEPIRLLNRLTKRQEEVLEFLYQRDVPFENNRAENDVRMTKVKQKVSGTFRTPDGAEYFARIRGFISTCQKQGINVLEGIRTVFEGKPCLIS